MSHQHPVTYDVLVYKERELTDKPRRKPWQARWKVAGVVFSETFAKSKLAQNFTNKLEAAASEGIPFDIELGLPVPMAREIRQAHAAENEPDWLKVATQYAMYAWEQNRGNSRVGTAAMLTDITVAMLPSMPNGRQSKVRQALRHWAFKKVSDDVKAAHEPVEMLRWVADNCPTISGLTDPARLRTILDRLTRNLNGQLASASTFAKRRVVLHAVFEYAITAEFMTQNPLDAPRLRWTTPKRLKKSARSVHPRQLGTTNQVEHLLTSMSYVGSSQGRRFVPFFGCMYYALMRPEEVMALHLDQCELPLTGWGRLTLEAAEPDVGVGWTDSGERHERQELKHRGVGETRPIPIPPRLVELLRAYVNDFGTGTGGRLFRSVNGRPIQSSTYRKVLLDSREFAYAPVERSGPRLRRAYDFRHSGIVLRLNAGVPVKQVAAWAGHSVQVLLSTYANVLEGLDSHWHDRIDDAMKIGS